jgi:hypothetical protein
LGLPLADQQFEQHPDGQMHLKRPELDKALDRIVASVIRQATWRIAELG